MNEDVSVRVMDSSIEDTKVMTVKCGSYLQVLLPLLLFLLLLLPLRQLAQDLRHPGSTKEEPERQQDPPRLEVTEQEEEEEEEGLEEQEAVQRLQ
jgi:flagellar biosynthesis/type III secretory pathway M-ring protein FliF/YscJ